MSAGKTESETYDWVDDEHVMSAGLVAGALLRHGIPVEPMVKDGVVTPFLVITIEGFRDVTVAVLPDGDHLRGRT